MPSAGFEWVVGDVRTISGTSVAVPPATIVSVEVRIRGTAIAESVTLGSGTWTVDHTVVEDDEYAIALITAHIVDSLGRSFDTLPVQGIIYPTDGSSHEYYYLPETGEWLVDTGGEFVIEPP